MAKKRKAKNKFPSDGALLKNGIYAVKGAKPKRVSKRRVYMHNAALSKAAADAIEKGKQMARIEAYAKEHRVTILQAMVHFMETKQVSKNASRKAEAPAAANSATPCITPPHQ